MMGALFEHGLTAHVYLKVYNKLVTWPANRSLADDLYFAYVVARYQGYTNVVWDFAKESDNEPDKDYLASRLRFVRAHDGYQRLVTTHDDDLFDADPRYLGSTDFVTDQYHVDIGQHRVHRRASRRPVRQRGVRLRVRAGRAGGQDVRPLQHPGGARAAQLGGGAGARIPATTTPTPPGT